MTDLAAALNDLIASAKATPAPAPRHPVRCPRTGGVYMFVNTAAEAEALTARLAA